MQTAPPVPVGDRFQHDADTTSIGRAQVDAEQSASVVQLHCDDDVQISRRSTASAQRRQERLGRKRKKATEYAKLKEGVCAAAASQRSCTQNDTSDTSKLGLCEALELQRSQEAAEEDIKHNVLGSSGGIARLLRRFLRGTEVETVAAALSWAVCSVSMTLVNHEVAQQSEAPLVLTLIQMVAAVIFAILTGRAQFGAGAVTWAATVPILFTTMLATSMMAFLYVSVGAFVVVRNLGPIITLVIEAIVTRGRSESVRCTLKSVASTATIALGVYIYEVNDIKFSLVGLLILFVNLISAVVERLVERHLLHGEGKVDVSHMGLVVISNGVGAVLLSAFILVYDPAQFAQMWRALSTYEQRGYTMLLTSISCVIGTGISYAGIWLQSLISATSFTVLGTSTKTLVIMWGMIFDADASSPLAIIGIAMTLVGGVLYSLNSVPGCWTLPKDGLFAGVRVEEISDDKRVLVCSSTVCTPPKLAVAFASGCLGGVVVAGVVVCVVVGSDALPSRADWLVNVPFLDGHSPPAAPSRPQPSPMKI